MRLCIFDDHRIGVVDGCEVVDITAVFDATFVPVWPYPMDDRVVRDFPAVRSLVGQAVCSAKRYPLASVRLRSPVANPGKIIGAPINYRAHIDEANADVQINHGKTYTRLDQYGLFLKANSSLIGCGDEVVLPFPDRRTDHEVELAVIIGRQAKRVSREHALDYVFGYSIGLDMTVRGAEWPGFRKSPDSFSVIGPWMVTADEIHDPNNLELVLTVNEVLRQQSNTRYLIFNVQHLIEYASAMYTLHPGDILMTGTPAGVGPVVEGDVMQASIPQIGSMKVRVAADH